MTNVTDKSRGENQNTEFFFRRSCHLRDAVEKCDSAGQAADDYNTVHALCMLDN
jgi:hypothetical protein